MVAWLSSVLAQRVLHLAVSRALKWIKGIDIAWRGLHILPPYILHQRFHIPAIVIGPVRKAPSERMATIMAMILSYCLLSQFPEQWHNTVGVESARQFKK